jgi:hypothetical protein
MENKLLLWKVQGLLIYECICTAQGERIFTESAGMEGCSQDQKAMAGSESRGLLFELEGRVRELHLC